jgi:hypothetical protein
MRFANAGGRECGTGVAVDKRVNPATGAPYDAIFLTGFFGGYITFGGTTLMDAGGFLAKFSPDGTNLWSRGSGSNNASPGPIAVDSNGDVAISGAFAVQTDVGGGAIIGTGVFIAKYSGSVGSYLWASVIGGTVNGRSMTADAHNNIILAGNFSGTCNFGGQSLTSMYYGGFLAKYSGTGTPIWVVNMIGSTDESLNAVAVDASGYPIVTGGFAGTASLAGQSLTSAGSTDIVLGRVNQ